MEVSWRFDAAGALIVVAELGKSDFAWLDGLRKKYYPPDRNRVPAHLTLFRALPPSAEEEVRRSLSRAVRMPRPRADLYGAMDLDTGVALRISSPELESMREDLAKEFRGLLTSQDEGRWTPHVTIQNKVEPSVARKLLQQLRMGFEARPIEIAGLQLVRYDEGVWQPLARFAFRGT